MSLPAFNLWRNTKWPNVNPAYFGSEPLSAGSRWPPEGGGETRRGFDRNVPTKGRSGQVMCGGWERPRLSLTGLSDSGQRLVSLGSTRRTEDDGKCFRRRVSAGPGWPQRSLTRLQPHRAKQNITSNQLRGEPSCCRGSGEAGRSETAAGR